MQDNCPKDFWVKHPDGSVYKRNNETDLLEKLSDQSS